MTFNFALLLQLGDNPFDDELSILIYRVICRDFFSNRKDDISIFYLFLYKLNAR